MFMTSEFYRPTVNILRDYVLQWRKRATEANRLTVDLKQSGCVLAPPWERATSYPAALVELGVLTGFEAASEKYRFEFVLSYAVVEAIVERSFSNPDEPPDNAARAVLDRIGIFGSCPISNSPQAI